MADIIKARIIDNNKLVKAFEAQREQELYNPNFVPKVVIQRGYEYEKGFDWKCLTWSTNKVLSGWTRDKRDSDFFIDYYVPPNKDAIICVSPALAAVITAAKGKPFIYEAYPTEYGLRIRIIIGASEAREMCQRLTGDANCANFFLSQEATVRYEP
ncbi:hypothetical protein [Scytonema sp. UIC 10036]|uniref:hypothetical protein n=1 Tax=Scytonema sp. UIC 10036 TaxID=2304196 RepID=UPI001FA9DBA7|nr:hypothetical protein [Scytonema sp. UIC 10036]